MDIFKIISVYMNAHAYLYREWKHFSHYELNLHLWAPFSSQWCERKVEGQGKSWVAYHKHLPFPIRYFWKPHLEVCSKYSEMMWLVDKSLCLIACVIKANFVVCLKLGGKYSNNSDFSSQRRRKDSALDST